MDDAEYDDRFDNYGSADNYGDTYGSSVPANYTGVETYDSGQTYDNYENAYDSYEPDEHYGGAYDSYAPDRNDGYHGETYDNYEYDDEYMYYWDALQDYK